ncbi:uncharacterized protein LOC143920237 [Arctopsyche grandis]|uniref:uncharacterized protein LOC143920237 n=1 Tax=Arctopsyche grandis TaxID=121162 RepID=UPI00406D88A6
MKNPVLWLLGPLETTLELWPPAEYPYSGGGPSQGGSNLAVFVVLFAICTVEVILLKIMTMEMYVERIASGNSGSVWLADED